MSSFIQTFVGDAGAAFADDAVWTGEVDAVLAAGGFSPDGDPAVLRDDDLLAAVRRAEAIGRRVDAVRARLAAEAAQRSRRDLGAEGLARRLGCRSHVELLQRLTGAAGVTVNRRVRLGRAVRPSTTLIGHRGPAPFPHVATALAGGVLGADAALALIDTLRPTLRVADTTAVATAEHAILGEAVAREPGAAPVLDADTVRLQAQVWAAVLDPDGTEPTETDLQRRGLWLAAPRHGLIPVRGTLLPEVAAALTAYTHACTNPRAPHLPDPDPVPADHDPADHDDVPAHLTDPRSRAQQMHDVLATIIGVAARAADAPTLAGNAPTLVITVRADDLAAGRGTAFAEGSPLPVGMSAARQIACAGATQQVLLDPTGRVTGISSPQRCFTGPQRRAIATRDGGCVVPGCHVPAPWCETHHVTPHATDPTGTHTDNGVLLCWYHHRTIDTHGWDVRMVRGQPHIRAPRWIDPHGTWRPARGSPTTALQAVVASRRGAG